jgi:superfamily II DNA or RNA helicase
MVPSLARREDLAELVDSYGQVIVDECHHVSAVSFERVVAAARARHVELTIEYDPDAEIHHSNELV